MAANYEPIYGLSEDEVSFKLNQGHLKKKKKKSILQPRVSSRGVQPEMASVSPIGKLTTPYPG